MSSSIVLRALRGSYAAKLPVRMVRRLLESSQKSGVIKLGIKSASLLSPVFPATLTSAVSLVRLRITNPSSWLVCVLFSSLLPRPSMFSNSNSHSPLLFNVVTLSALFKTRKFSAVGTGSSIRLGMSALPDASFERYRPSAKPGMICDRTSIGTKRCYQVPATTMVRDGGLPVVAVVVSMYKCINQANSATRAAAAASASMSAVAWRGARRPRLSSTHARTRMSNESKAELLLDLWPTG